MVTVKKFTSTAFRITKHNKFRNAEDRKKFFKKITNGFLSSLDGVFLLFYEHNNTNNNNNNDDDLGENYYYDNQKPKY